MKDRKREKAVSMRSSFYDFQPGKPQWELSVKWQQQGDGKNSLRWQLGKGFAITPRDVGQVRVEQSKMMMRGAAAGRCWTDSVADWIAQSVTWVRGEVLKRAGRATNPCSKVGEKMEKSQERGERSQLPTSSTWRWCVASILVPKWPVQNNK